ncbi:hypothetical protein SU69_00610 [Thermosipho melanesiensis]|nr:hypothetical protein SU68_00610 [Thermosipho melanesiensis]OOC40539.1 hypothetical protein SU70_00610 [Thermosipho melanesiensis]OOC40803.1 hypothetical protein SU69_00610 [Thermosipho melanesiensis]OOC44649.1 hypothetical protein SU71_00600 [Thermosipho melanesiensis]OOC46003.1 hypothetical protein SU72_00600 [Thermosipho melanesiensis]
MKKVREQYKKVLVFISRPPFGKAKEMLEELKGYIEINVTSNFYKEARKKFKEIENAELRDLGDFGERAMMRDPC